MSAAPSTPPSHSGAAPEGRVSFVPPLADPDTRVERFARGAELGAVAQLLRERRSEILHRWLSAAGLQPFHRGQPDRLIADHIPELFDALVSLLEMSASPSVDAAAPLENPAMLAAAEAHARERVAQGLRPTDVVTEFRLLRQEIGRSLRRAFDEALHKAVGGERTGVSDGTATGILAASDKLASELLIHDALDGAIGLTLASLTGHLDSAVRELREHISEQQRVGQEQARLLDLAHDAIVVRAFGSGAIEFWNRGAETLYGWRREEVQGRPKIEVLQPELPRPLSELEAVLEQTGEWSGELQHVRRDGGRVVVASRWALQRDDAGHPRSVLEINRDVTAQRRAEDELRALAISLEERVAERTAALEVARQRAAFLAEAGSLLAGSLDYEQTLANVARLAVPSIADWCAVDMVAEEGTLRRLAVAHVDPAKVELAHELQRRYPPEPGAPSGVSHVVRSGEPEMAAEIPDAVLVQAARNEEDLALFRSLGLRSYMIVPLRVREATLGTISFVAAESSRRYGPDDLVLAEDLARRAAQAVDNARLYRQAQRSRAAAEAAVRLRDQVLAAIAHDLKAPLTAISGQAQLVARRARRLQPAPAAGEPGHPASAGPDATRLLTSANEILAAARRMARWIDQLSDLARTQIGHPLPLNRKSTELIALVEQVAAEHQRTTSVHQVRVIAEVPVLVGLWDRARLERLLDNLLGNAIKYSPEGGVVSVTVGCEPAADTSGADSKKEWAVLQVRDEGLGIPAADVPWIFEPFRRAGNVAAATAGTGVGLASARQVVAAHGGTISVESQEGKGSSFTVRLPLAPREGSHETEPRH